MVNFGPLAAEIVSLVWGTPANFNGFRSSLQIQDAKKRQKVAIFWAPSHNFVGLYLRN